MESEGYYQLGCQCGQIELWVQCQQDVQCSSYVFVVDEVEEYWLQVFEEDSQCYQCDVGIVYVILWIEFLCQLYCQLVFEVIVQ